MRWLLSLLLLGLLGVVNTLSTSGTRLLVVLEELSQKTKYSKFLGDLSDRGFEITVESPKDENLSLFHLGQRKYDHLILLPAKSKGLGPNLTPQLLLQFINAQGNILLTLDSAHPTPAGIVSLLLELDINLPTDRSSIVVDHFNYDSISASEKHDVVLLPRPDALRSDIRNFFRGTGKGGEYIAFPRGVGHTLGNESPLLSPVLRAPRTAYSYGTKDEGAGAEDPFAVGQQLSLVSVMQARNSARFTVLGAAEMLEDAWFDTKIKRSIGMNGVGTDAKKIKTSNQAFAKEISGWTFNEIGIMKVGRISHFLNEDGKQKANTTNPKMYRVKNQVSYEIEISEYSWDHYEPFLPEAGDDLQLEFSMLSPFHRRRLEPTTHKQNSTVFSTTFVVPDQHGIFNFMTEYRRPFLSNVEEKNTVTVRHFAHDEWPRSYTISGAYPWITGIAVTITAWVVFLSLWLWSAPVPLTTTEPGKKVQ